LSINDSASTGSEIHVSDLLDNLNEQLKSFTYSPNDNYGGVDVVTITANVDNGVMVINKFILNIEFVNDAPTITVGSNIVNVVGEETTGLGVIEVVDVDLLTSEFR